MANTFREYEFWLPPQFLTDDLTLLNMNLQNDAVLKARFPYLSSPAESVVGSNETESEEEDLMAQSSLQLGSSENQKIVFGTFSPKSTLCKLESSGKGSSPNDNVLPQANTQNATLDLLRAAAGEVERMKLHEEEKVYGVLRNTVKPSPIGPRIYPQQQQPHFLSLQQSQQQQHSLSLQQSQIAQYEMMRRQELATQQQGGLVWGGYGSNNYNNQMVPNRGRNDTVLQGLSLSAWPSLQLTNPQPQPQPQQQNGTVFPANASVKKERNGTGVFLPRVYNVPSESRKKPAASSAALVPEKGNNNNRFNEKSNMENGPALSKIGSDNGVSGQKHNLKLQPPPVNHEIQLPEWTY